MPKVTKGEGKRHPLNMRTTQGTRDRLETAAAASGRSLAQEVEYRLERTFIEEEVLGGAENRRMAHTLMLAGMHAQELTDGPFNRRQPEHYNRFMMTVLRMLLQDYPASRRERLTAIEGLFSMLATQKLDDLQALQAEADQQKDDAA